MIDDEDVDQAGCWFKLEAELIPQGLFKRGPPDSLDIIAAIFWLFCRREHDSEIIFSSESRLVHYGTFHAGILLGQCVRDLGHGYISCADIRAAILGFSYAADNRPACAWEVAGELWPRHLGGARCALRMRLELRPGFSGGR